MGIVIIGTGNVATVLGKKFCNAGFPVLQVFGRRGDQAQQLAAALHAASCTAWDDINPQADLYVCALSDAALYDLPPNLHFENGLLVHTAGSVPMDVLQHVSRSYGVLYPLQSLRKDLEPPDEIPLLIDANDPASLEVLRAVAARLSPLVITAGDEARRKLHVAAVFVNNFTNHLYALAESYCKQENLDFRLLLPLVVETARRITWASPGDVMTGPAARFDQQTIHQHLQLLLPHPRLQRLYRLLTESIQGK